MSNADDRCTHMLASGPCGVWRDTHPQIPFKPEFMHAFVEPAPQPAPSGDNTWVNTGNASIDAAYAAGKVDGARERREMSEPTPTDIADAFLAGCHRGKHDALAKLEQLRRKFSALERERKMLDKAIEAVRERK